MEKLGFIFCTIGYFNTGCFIGYFIGSLIGYFNTDINYSCMKTFCESYTLSSLAKEPKESFMH